MPTPLLSFLGDDFTGSTDALELLALAGLRTRLFTRVPGESELRGLDAYGVACETRSMDADDIERTLRELLPALASLPARLIHYKVCSTFDSSPEIGSIGRAIDVGFDVLRPRYVPVVAAAPSLGRFTAFGNHFARFGGDGEVFRLDRHPSVSRHPVTPMTEADLVQHLSRQTKRTVKLLDFRHYDTPASASIARLQHEFHAGAAVLLDLLREADLPRLGQMLDRPAEARFVVGSSGIESALLAWWQSSQPPSDRTSVSPAPSAARSPVAVLCGSCSPVSTGQVKWAAANGFKLVRLDVLTCDHTAAAREAIGHLRGGHNVIVHTAGDVKSPAADRAAIARALAAVGKALLEAVRIRRVVVAGGDTSGAVARALEIRSFEMVAPLVRGAPIVRAAAPQSPADKVEFVFKGGQVGNADFFAVAVSGVRSGV